MIINLIMLAKLDKSRVHYVIMLNFFYSFLVRSWVPPVSVSIHFVAENVIRKGDGVI